MKGLREKFRNKKGFTLVEMLIVVAIIAILIAVSIPMIGGALEKTREAVDDANHRDAIALGNIAFLTGEADFSADATDKTYYYVVSDDHQGKLVPTSDTGATPEAAKCTCPSRTTGSKSAKGNVITVTVKSSGEVSAAWGPKN